ncbi:hypothetical protein LAV_00201 [Sphingobium phage Lacusarx]|uniref:Uncharacterized protein n=1 Tax=Sphingobium phage Lacusarx TaxID=1980139 RepID=A0A1W6DXI8_9CAUD|nr:DNA ligase [Sphingobium phage Lacusarx]ARK07576.1 hypothetical protein LAV_00201 [Sphingobium phage Lacusarx]
MSEPVKIATVADFDAALAEPYAWPGGYPRFFITKDGQALSYKAAEREADNIRESITERANDGYLVDAVAINWEDNSLYCDITGDRIESAYAEPDEEESTNG